jgi:hypothetical protein
VFQLRGEAFNALNTPFLGQPNGVGFATSNSIIPDAPRVAEIRTLRGPMRIIQIGAKIRF